MVPIEPQGNSAERENQETRSHDCNHFGKKTLIHRLQNYPEGKEGGAARQHGCQDKARAFLKGDAVKRHAEQDQEQSQAGPVRMNIYFADILELGLRRVRFYNTWIIVSSRIPVVGE